ncbi:autotransporter strand-loop-strand O-heptosyltransferase [Serratia sp. Leaf51]|nr:autotransporter strand-loop-strand O-heptosyltransferase [Serratia sp. Leaf51]
MDSAYNADYPFIVPPNLPTQEGPGGILFDFNDGARVYLPAGNWVLELSDDDSGNVLFKDSLKGGWVVSTKKYYIRFRIKVWQGDNITPFFDHILNLESKKVLISFPVGTLGDLIGWVPYAERFRIVNKTSVTCTLAHNIAEIFENTYKELIFYDHELYKSNIDKQPKPYATYRIGLFFNQDTVNQPIDFRMVGLHRTAGYILGVNPEEIRPNIRTDFKNTFNERYVCIATMSTCQAKFWNNKTGWDEVVAYLKCQGYRVLCIDRDPVVGQGYVWNRIPNGAEDFTGALPLKERINLLQHAEFFIGLASGLSWLAWACQIPVVLISGFSLPNCEFYTPYRVFNSQFCNGCWDDTKVNFEHKDFFWCPRFKNTVQQYECTRYITGKQVINVLHRLINP